MKKRVFKRVLAAFLTMLMILTTLPLSALAWTTSMPDLMFSDVISVDDYIKYKDTMEPQIVVTVSTQNKRNEYYPKSADAEILNGADLKAGQKIAVTFEIAGLEAYYSAQVLGYYNTELLTPKYWKMTKWTEADTTNAVLIKGGLLYAAIPTSMIDNTAVVDLETGRFGTSISDTNKPEDLFYIGDAPTCNSEYLEPAMEADTVGLLMGTFSFEVNKDCDIKDCFNLDTDVDHGCFVQWGTEDYQRYIIPNYTEVDPRIDYTRFNDPDGNPVREPFELVYRNYDASEPVTNHTVTYKDVDGSELGTETVADGATATQVPELPANDYDTENHYTYSWDGDTTAPITADTTFQIVKTGTPHKYTSEVIQNQDYGQDEITRYTCDCGYSYDKVTAAGLTHEHHYGDPVADYESGQTYNEETAYTHTATCDAAGTCDEKTVTSKCTFDNGVVTTPRDYGQAEITTYTCTVCGGTYTKETAPALTHEHHYGDPVADYESGQTYNKETAYTHTATCDAAGTCDEKTVTSDCTFDTGKVIQEAGIDQPEITEYKCTVCGGTYTKETAPAIKGYDVTVNASDSGIISMDKEAIDSESLTKKVAVNSTVTLKAEPFENCEFVGWRVGNKIVSTELTYSPVINAPVTFTPVFVDKANAYEFVFLDMFANVISSQSVSDASQVVMPNDPVYNGYKFTGWSVDADTIHQAKESMTIYAQFEKDTDANYTVNADGATISYGDVSAENTLNDIPYGTQVTVTKDGATGWQINGADVAYGDSYTFYVASDVTVAPITSAVDVKPVVTAVSYSKLNDSCRVEFVASRAMTDDCTYISSGWVYGKNLSEDDLTLDMVGQVGTGTDSGVVKAAYVSSTEGSTQFILSYGITSQTGTASAKAFLTYKDAEGAIHTVYSDAMNYTYGA